MQVVRIASGKTFWLMEGLEMLYMYYQPLQFAIEISVSSPILKDVWFRNQSHILFCLREKTCYFQGVEADIHIFKNHFLYTT